MSNRVRLANLPMRQQLMLVFASLSIATTAATALLLTTLGSQRLQASLREKSVQYARQLQRDLEPVIAFDDHVTARERFGSLMGDRDVDGLAIYNAHGELLEGRGQFPATVPSLASDVGADPGRMIAIAEIASREGRNGRVFVALSTRSIQELRRRDIWSAAGIGALIVCGALALAARGSRRVVGRLERISNAAVLMASGDTDRSHLDDRARDEIGGLARAFDAMVTELKRLSGEHEALVTSERERLETQVSERTQALEQSREMFRLMAESTKAAPFTLDLSGGNFTYIGSQVVAASGVPEPQWKLPGALEVIVPRGANAELRRRMDECVPGPFDFESTWAREGERSEVRWSGTCEASGGTKLLRGLMQNVTEMRRLEHDLAAAQKLETVGRLAAGVAHEINTPVQFVSDNVQFVSGTLGDLANVIQSYRALQAAVQSGDGVPDAAKRASQAEVDADLDYIMKDAPLALEGAVEGLRRIATIVRSMKEFAHPDQATKTLADLNQAVQSTLVIAHNEYKYLAEVETHFGELPLVPCYLSEFNQVFLNLLINASHAIGDVVKNTGELGKLTVRSRVDRDTVEISVTDTGTGIPEAIRDRIFDPFFTTKEVGRGTGQGLAIARSVIVNKHGGTLHFETQCGKGTTFFIRLPANALDLSSTEAAA